MLAYKYLMENDKEAIRMDMKTDPVVIEKQAVRAGIQPNMRIADIGCGPGKTTYYLSRLIIPHGTAVGLDNSGERIAYAKKHYSGDNIDFICRDVHEPLTDIGQFDFIWVRFVLEYYKSTSFDIVKKLTDILKPGGILCLIDLDLNSMNHYALPQNLENSLHGMIQALEDERDFDPYAGRKLYSFLYDLNYTHINIDIKAHHMIYGKLQEKDEFNWITKVMVAGKNSGYDFYKDFKDGFDGFYASFKRFFTDPRRFTYTPVIACCGRKPVLQFS
ncbi:MAG: class I SAM-dependent methyltransferase [Desulfobacterales bacterium]|nr:class I SAM-dependent methyltransferase [Desulfobacterales bacterium]